MARIPTNKPATKDELEQMISKYYDARQRQLRAKLDYRIAEKEASLALASVIDMSNEVEGVALQLFLRETDK